jgi:hypothetical protein
MIHLMFTAGVIFLSAAAFLGAVPFFKRYKSPIQLLGFIILGFGIYYEGALAFKNAQALAVAQLQTKLKEAEAKGAVVNTQIVEKVVKDTQVIHDKGKTITQYVDREVVKHDQECKLPKEVINAHNMAATLNTDAAKTTDGAPK